MSFAFFHSYSCIFLYPHAKNQPQTRKTIFGPKMGVLPMLGLAVGGKLAWWCPLVATVLCKIHKLPMNFIFLPCHFLFFHAIIQFGILETYPNFFSLNRAIFLFFPNFPIFRIRKIIINQPDLQIEFRFFLWVHDIFLHPSAKNQPKIQCFTIFSKGV